MVYLINYLQNHHVNNKRGKTPEKTKHEGNLKNQPTAVPGRKIHSDTGQPPTIEPTTTTPPDYVSALRKKVSNPTPKLPSEKVRHD